LGRRRNEEMSWSLIKFLRSWIVIIFSEGEKVIIFEELKIFVKIFQSDESERPYEIVMKVGL